MKGWRIGRTREVPEGCLHEPQGHHCNVRGALGDLDYKALERSGLGWASNEQMAYEAPHVAQVMSVEFSQPPSEVVGDSNVVGILHKIL